jgi:aryl-alcohol dehydrogenase-like predicted oxidoreductase
MNPRDIAKIISEDIHTANGLITEAKMPMPKRTLGKTGYKVGLFSLGGQGSLEKQGTEKNCVQIIQRAYELGVNYFDTSPIYGPSEEYYGKAMKGFRNKIFLASKTDDRTRDGSLKIIEKSLKRLKTDYLDLWQLHHLDRMEEVNQITKKGGALEALLEMKEQKVVRHIGFTGHEDPTILVEMSKRHDFDTVLCAINCADKHVKPSFIETMLPQAKKQNLGVIGMKVLAQGYVFDPEKMTTVWEPIHYSLSQDVDMVIMGCDTVAQLEENILIAKAFEPLTKIQMKDIEGRMKGLVRRACFFRKKFGGYDSKNKLGGTYRVSKD